LVGLALVGLAAFLVAMVALVLAILNCVNSVWPRGHKHARHGIRGDAQQLPGPACHPAPTLPPRRLQPAQLSRSPFPPLSPRQARKAGACLALNPGSATGAYSLTWPAGAPPPTPSFVLMDLDGAKVRRG
jgi:hypothetical protein